MGTIQGYRLGQVRKGTGSGNGFQEPWEKRAPKEAAQEYGMVREICTQCFKLLGGDSSFNKNGNVIGCMKVKASEMAGRLD